MSRFVALGLVATLLVVHINGDVYLHMPRGSNNRLNEKAANRDNDNRLFDSQNNGRGGYNVGDKTDNAFDGGTAPYGYYDVDTTMNYNQKTTAMQYQFAYYENSILSVEWTNQHGCGGNEVDDPQILNCNILLQYMCDTDNTVTDPAMTVVLRDGGNTQTPNEPGSYTDVPAQNIERGHHESEAYYYECKTRSRNKGLFHADQRPNGQTAIYTRQNNNGNRRGLECVEERDYYPYWGPTPWRDVVYMTDDVSRCPYIIANSQNTVDKCKCVGNDAAIEVIEGAAECTEAGGQWKCFKHSIASPECRQVEWSRANHLGNGRHGQPLLYNWTIPSFAKLGNGVKKYGSASNYAKCVFRLRYNISTDDYNPWNINSTQDDNQEKGIVSPIQNNPTVDVGADLQGLRLAINTAQFGRTFQDRSHVFYIKQLPAAFAGYKIYNLNVRGKRGNIVQTYPSVEYDFQPNRMHVKTNELIHIQWTGSNTHNNGAPGGDGQTGDAGEGTGGTDRHNFVQMLNKDDNFPIPLDKFQTENIFAKSQCYLPDGNQVASWVDCALILATSGYFRTVAAADDTFDPLLNTSPASLVGGIVMGFSPSSVGEYNYMCTRNNNFSNRSQKGVLIVEAP